MAHRILMQVVITGSQVVGKAFMEAYRQASSASLKATANAAAREKSGGLSLAEARKILGIEDGEIDMDVARKKYNYLFNANSAEQSGSFYLQSKVYRAFERVKYEMEPDAKPEPSSDAKAEAKTPPSSNANEKGDAEK